MEIAAAFDLPRRHWCTVLWQIRSSHPEVLHHSLPSEDSDSADETTATVVKSEEKGLSDLVRLCVGRPLDKAQQMSDWERRPLRRRQILYAGVHSIEFQASAHFSTLLPLHVTAMTLCCSDGWNLLNERCESFVSNCMGPRKSHKSYPKQSPNKVTDKPVENSIYIQNLNLAVMFLYWVLISVCIILWKQFLREN